MQRYYLLPSPHLSPLHSFLTALDNSTRQMRRPSLTRAYTSLPSNASPRSASASHDSDSLYNTLAIQNSPTGSPEPVRALDPLKPSTLSSSEPARVACRLQTVRSMLDADLRVLLAPLSFVLTSPTPFPTPYFAMFSSRCRRSPGQRSGLSCAAHAARCVPHRACKSHPSTMRRRCARHKPRQAWQSLRSVVSPEGLTLGLAGRGRGSGSGTVEAAPDCAHVIWRVCPHSSLLRCF